VREFFLDGYMTTEEMNKFAEWAINDPFLSKFIWRQGQYDDLYLFASPLKICPEIFLIIVDDSYQCKTRDIVKIDKSLSIDWQLLTFSDDEMMKTLPLEDAKKYVYDLAKYGVMRLNRIKKKSLLKSLDEL